MTEPTRRRRGDLPGAGSPTTTRPVTVDGAAEAGEPAETGTARPTPGQRVILRVLAEGGLLHNPYGLLFELKARPGSWRWVLRTVREATVKMLRARGWLDNQLEITPAGREVIAQKGWP